MRKKPKGMNPVQRAIVKSTFASLLTGFRIKLYLMADGEDATALLADLAHVLTPIAAAGSVQFGRDTPWVRQLHGAMRTLHAMCMDNYEWDSRSAASLDVAVALAQDKLPLIRTDLIAGAISEGQYFAGLILLHKVDKDTVTT